MDYVDARAEYPHLFPSEQVHTQSGGLRVLLDREEIQRAAQHLGIKPVILVSPYGFLILHLVQRPNGEYGTHHQMGSKVQLDGRIGVTAFPVWVDGQGLKRTCLVKHFRVTLAWMPEAYGSGWELEFPAFGAEHEQGIVSSVQQELMEEAGLRLVGDPRRLDAEDDAHPGFALFPGISSHIE